MIKLISAYHYEHLKNDYVTTHNHNCFELVFYECGKALISIQNASYTITAPAVAIIPPHLKHDEKEFLKTSVYVFQYEVDERSSNDIEINILSEVQSQKLKDVLKQIIPFDLNNMSKQEKQQKNQLFSIIFSLLRIFKFSTNDDTDQTAAVAFVKNFIKKNYMLKINYESLALSYGYSYSRLRHIFKKIAGVSIHKYCASIRLSNAKYLLSDTNYSINKIANLCGFSSPTLFDIFFKKEMNTSPLEFRNLVRTQNEGDVIRMGEEK